MNADSEVRFLLAETPSVAELQRRWSADTVSRWLSMPKYQHDICLAIMYEATWGIALLEWLGNEGAFSVVSSPIILSGRDYRSFVHYAVVCESPDSPMFQFCMQKARLHLRSNRRVFETLLHQLCESVPWACPERVHQIIDAGNLTQDTVAHCDNQNCATHIWDAIIAQRRRCLQSVTVLLGLRRRSPLVQRCANKDVLTMIGKLVWAQRWRKT